MKIKRKRSGIVFWITGFPGSGKTSISERIYSSIQKDYGPTLRLSGDEARKLLKVNGYSRQQRFKIGLKYHEFCKKISNSGVNVLFDVACLIEKIRKKNRKYLKNYLVTLIKVIIIC